MSNVCILSAKLFFAVLFIYFKTTITKQYYKGQLICYKSKLLGGGEGEVFLLILVDGVTRNASVVSSVTSLEMYICLCTAVHQVKPSQDFVLIEQHNF